jgi:hypothetical protein
MRQSHLKLTALFVLITLVLAFAGCGGGGGNSSSSSTASTSTSSGTGSQFSTGSGSKQQKPAPTGDQSITGFGQEAGGQDRSSLLGAFHGFLGAMGAGDYATACSYLSEATTKSLEQVVVPQLRAKGCPAILPKLLSSSAAGTSRQQANGQVKKIRIKGDRAFVTYHAPGAILYVLPMVKERGGWKATSIAGSILIPSPSAIGAAP